MDSSQHLYKKTKDFLLKSEVMSQRVGNNIRNKLMNNKEIKSYTPSIDMF